MEKFVLWVWHNLVYALKLIIKCVEKRKPYGSAKRKVKDDNIHEESEDNNHG